MFSWQTYSWTSAFGTQRMSQPIVNGLVYAPGSSIVPFVMHGGVVRAREAFDEMRFPSPHITAAVQPVSFVETHGVDHKRIAFPVADRMT